MTKGQFCVLIASGVAWAVIAWQNHNSVTMYLVAFAQVLMAVILQDVYGWKRRPPADENHAAHANCANCQADAEEMAFAHVVVTVLVIAVTAFAYWLFFVRWGGGPR